MGSRICEDLASYFLVVFSGKNRRLFFVEKVKKIKNFLLSKVKSDLSDKAPILSKEQITNVVEYNLHVIDELLLDLEGVTYAEYAPSNKQHKILRSFISTLAYQGFTQAKEITLAEKFNVSRPTLRSVIEFLEDLGVIHKLLNRRKAKRAPSVYILALHPYYLNNLKYFKQNFIEDICVSEIYTSYFTKDFTELFTKAKSQTPCESKAETPKKSLTKLTKLTLLKIISYIEKTIFQMIKIFHLRNTIMKKKNTQLLKVYLQKLLRN